MFATQNSHFFGNTLDKFKQLLYQSFSESDKSNYDFIRVIILGDNNEKIEGEFSIKDLNIFVESSKRMSKFFELLKKEDYKTIFNLLNNEALKVTTLENVTIFFEEINMKYGKPNEFSLQGFTFIEYNSENKIENLIKISGVIVREKQSTDFSITIEPINSTGYLYGFKYEK